MKTEKELWDKAVCCVCKERTGDLMGWDHWNCVCLKCWKREGSPKMKEIFNDMSQYVSPENAVLKAFDKESK